MLWLQRGGAMKKDIQAAMKHKSRGLPESPQEAEQDLDSGEDSPTLGGGTWRGR